MAALQPLSAGPEGHGAFYLWPHLPEPHVARFRCLTALAPLLRADFDFLPLHPHGFIIWKFLCRKVQEITDLEHGVTGEA
ncbi:hypothetical protein DI396_15245 [Litorivita pollutaquae]|uniref:Uncharacterized protein n=1 Tax=Litorivita pollutaquae TaxID=2200892 RepID=A0A2V4MQW2_9RHOB|nr:hypothetical protein A9Q95_07905 [Rhodobacterales bacterium 59_46_T64]PYC46488.1 hypothetical protein DI396_15245 [Litorivita pollutaquae]